MRSLSFLYFQDFLQTNAGLVILIVAAVVVGLLVIAVPFWLVLRKVFGSEKQNERILATGEPAQAIVLRMWETGMTINDNPQIQILLEVRPANRPPYQTQTKCMISRLKLALVQPDAVVAVRIDPQNQSKVALYIA